MAGNIDIKVGHALEKLIENKASLPVRARKDLETHIEEYKRLIAKMAHKYVRNRVEYDDLTQEAMIGLILADRDFDETRSSDFHTYAIYRMKGKMYEYCIGNESPIYVPTHVAKAASYVKQMRRLLEKEPLFARVELDAEEVIKVKKHKAEANFLDTTVADLKELKRKLGRIAYNSKMEYEKLADLAIKSLSLIVSDEVLMKVPDDADDIDHAVLSSELKDQLKELLGVKRYTVLELRAQEWSYREIADKLFNLGHTNKEGGVISRQAVKGILDDTLRAIKKSKLYKNLTEDESSQVEN